MAQPAMSRRRYAAARGVDEAAIRKAIKAGRIVPNADGLVDPDQADRNWYRYSQANPETHAVVDPTVLDDDYIRRVLAEEPPPYDDTGIQHLLAGLPEDRIAEQIEALRREVAELRKELRDRPHLPWARRRAPAWAGRFEAVDGRSAAPGQPEAGRQAVDRRG
jgi:hypothetical protein